MPTWLATMMSVLTGGALTMVAAWLGDRRMTERDRERRREERRERLATRRDDFQRETLLALQDLSQKLLRNTAASLHQDVIAHRNGGEWQRQQLPDNLSNDELRLKTETMLLASRVRDKKVRELVDQLRGQTVGVSLSSNEREAEGRMMAAADTQSMLLQRIGELIRKLDEEV